MLKEKDLHYLWRYGLFDVLNVKTTEGVSIEIKSFGVYNELNAGPDFSNARILIGDTLWSGNVEIHKKASDWFEHLHHFDPAYNNVILHVVWENDVTPIKWIKNIPVLELKSFIKGDVVDLIQTLKASPNDKIPCSNLEPEIEDFKWFKYSERLIIDRFSKKVSEVELLYKISEKDLNWVGFQIFARSLGAKLNKEPFQILSRLIKFNYLKKHADNTLQVEAMVFGVAGMLEDDFDDLYPNKLKEEFQFLQRKYKLETMEAFQWKWLRLRPNSFPSIQLALLCAWFFESQSNFKLLNSAISFKDFRKNVKLNLNSYWSNHYQFDKPSKNRSLNVGEMVLKRIYINAYLPYYSFILQLKGQNDYSFIIDQLCSIKKETNSITSKFETIGFHNRHSMHSQAILQLNSEFCLGKKCLNCEIGLNLLKGKNKDERLLKENF